MQQQERYHVYIDYKGYMIDPKSYRVTPAPLLGSKFATGSAAYSNLDFWQVGAMTDFTHGLNQKYMVDPSGYFQSVGISPLKPGEFRLERDLTNFSVPGSMGQVSARYRHTDGLYLGTEDGDIYYSSTGAAFSLVYSTGEDRITGFYELAGRFFANTGNGSIYSRIDGVWSKTCYGVEQNGWIKFNEGVNPTKYKEIYDTKKYAQSFKVPASSSSWSSLMLFMSKVGTPSDLTVSIYLGKDNGFDKDDPDALIMSTTIGAGAVSTTPGYVTKIFPSIIELNSALTYWLVFETTGGNTSNEWRIFYSTGQRATMAAGFLWKHVSEADFTDLDVPSSISSYAQVSGADELAQSFKVDFTKSFTRLRTVLGRLSGAPADSLTITIESDSGGNPDGNALAAFSISQSEVTQIPKIIEKTLANPFQLTAGTTYWIRYKSPNSTLPNAWMVSRTSESYSKGSLKSSSNSGSSWSALPLNTFFSIEEARDWDSEDNSDFVFKLLRSPDIGMFYTMVESDFGFGWFYDGIRRSTDGFNWLPEAPDPLWVTPFAEGTVKNAVAIPRGFLSGSIRGLWIFIGGSSGINLWQFPDYQSTTNFLGMDKWSHYGIFSVDKLGIYFTDGSQIYPTNLISIGEGFSCNYCTNIFTSGSDIYATVSDNGTDWYLARCNLLYQKAPQYWWLVKKLSKKPKYLAGFDSNKMYVFYDDKTCQLYDKDAGPYQTSGYIVTSMIDSNVVKLLKQYHSISAIFTQFPTNTSVIFGQRSNFIDAFDTETITSTYSIDGSLEAVKILPNPTLHNKIQLKMQLQTSDSSTTPIVTDLTWKYILERPLEDPLQKLAFNMTILANDGLEDASRNLDNENLLEPFRTRLDIIDSLRATASKKQAVNFIGSDNVSEIGIELNYSGAATTCSLSIDRTNYLLTTKENGVQVLSYDYYNKTLQDVVDYINTNTDYTANVHQDQDTTRSAHDMEPRLNLDLKDSIYIMVGSDVHSVIILPQTPTQQKMFLDGRGEDRITISMRDI